MSGLQEWRLGNPEPFSGVLYHWTGGLSGARCYLPFRGIKRWPWELLWLVQGVFCAGILPFFFYSMGQTKRVRYDFGSVRNWGDGDLAGAR
jgi:hypothetical protein